MMMHKCYSVSRSSIDENNDSVSRSWIVFYHGTVSQLTSVTEYFAAEDLAILLLWSDYGTARRLPTLEY